MGGIGVLKEFFKKRSKKPVFSVQVELTNNCNYSCAFCPQSHWRKPEFSERPYDRAKGYMDYDLFRKVIDEAGEISEEVNFSFFGEPTSHPEFLKFMDYLKTRNPELRVVMNTNLSYATREVFAKLIEIKLADLRLSIDAATPATYDRVRPGSFFLDLDGRPGKGDRFETICEKAAYWHSLPDHRPTRHVFTMCSINMNEARPFVERWLPLLGDNDIILVKSVLTYGGKMSDGMVSPNPCNVWESNLLTVDWTGNVSPCNLDTNMELVIGSVREKKLMEIFKNDKYGEFKRLSVRKDISPCSTCVDANNWSKNRIFKKGDAWRDL